MSFTKGQRVLLLQNFISNEFSVLKNETGVVNKSYRDGSVTIDFKSKRLVKFNRNELKQWLAPKGIRPVISALSPPSYQDSFNMPSHSIYISASEYHPSEPWRTMVPPSYQDAVRMSECSTCATVPLVPSQHEIRRVPIHFKSSPKKNLQHQNGSGSKRRAKPNTNYVPLSLSRSSGSKLANKERSTSPPKEEKKQEQEEDSRLICAICMDREKNVALIPCGHRFCSQCARDLEKCPMDRSIIKDRLRTFDWRHIG